MAKSLQKSAELTSVELCRRTNPEELGFTTTAELPDLQGVIGQPRALRAFELGSELDGSGYNTFVLGIPGSGRTTLSREYLERKARGQPIPDDWCYVTNFANPRQPKALHLPPGRANSLKTDLNDLIQRTDSGIRQAFESEEYTQAHAELLNTLKKQQEAEFIRLQNHVEKFNFVIVRTTFGFVLTPAVEGKPLKSEDIEKLSSEQQEKLKKLQAKLGVEVEQTLNRLREKEKLTRSEIVELNERTVLFLLEPMLAELEEKYTGLDEVLVYLGAVKTDIVEHADQFRADQSEDGSNPLLAFAQREWSRRYEVNVLVDHSELEGAPVVVENQPAYNNLIGRIEHEAMMGASRTDFTMIQAGALHRANGGYLILPARDLLMNAYAWEGLKRVLRDREIRIIELANQLGLLSTLTLEPEPIPLDLKVFLIGTPLLYYLLQTYDEDFGKLFKVRAEFAATMTRSPETEREYGLFVQSVVNDNQLPAFDRAAVARIIDHSARIAENQERLSTRFGKIADLVRESAFWARKNQTGESPDGGDVVVTAADVQAAIQENTYRSNLYEERLQDLFEAGTLLVDVSGRATGQINALSILMLGDYSFGRPSRVTATAFPGRSGVVDIERVAKLGGPAHTKGILILNGLLGTRFALNQQLSLAANLTFEQSYAGVEGDSASAAEYLALLSAIAQVPLRQDRAVTGSINQHGEVQAIGGVNEKIEGFYAICKLKGLTGEQGVIIPEANRRHLMLDEEVTRAVEAGNFHVWAVAGVDEIIPLLTDLPAGERQEDGSYPEDSFHAAVLARLEDFSRATEAEKPRSNQNKITPGAEGEVPPQPPPTGEPDLPE